MTALLLAAVNLFAQTFGGSWTCTGGYHWRITPAPGLGWAIVQWGPRSADGGTAYVGYVPKLDAWIYEDFHGDGTYAADKSKGPIAGAWTWTGTYYTPHSAAGGSVIWRRANAKQIDRTFNFTVNGKPRQAHDSCTAN